MSTIDVNGLISLAFFSLLLLCFTEKFGQLSVEGGCKCAFLFLAKLFWAAFDLAGISHVAHEITYG